MSVIPRDQAADLRQLMAARDFDDEPARVPSRRRTARVIAVASGKGGVGKTSIAVNLAWRMSQSGHHVVLVDADLGTANVDLMLNVHPSHDLTSLLRDRRRVDDILLRVNSRFDLIAGASGIAGVADLSMLDRRHLIEELGRLEERFDIILIDCGAGISQNVMAFARAADDLILVTTPEPTAVTDAYALVKVLSRSEFVPEIGVVMNLANTEREGRQAAERLTAVASRFLKVDISVLGHIPRDEHVARAVRERIPFVVQYPRSSASTCISALADRIARPLDQECSDVGFFRRVFRFFH